MSSRPSYEELLAENAELKTLVASLLARVDELEARLGKNSQNSSRPPSSDGYTKPPPRSRRQVSGRAPGKQPGEPGFTLRQVETPDKVITHVPVACGDCQRSLRRAAVVSTEARQVFDVEVAALRVIEHRLQHRLCRCGHKTMADVPDGVNAPVQYGPVVRSFATYLYGYQHLPYERAAETLRDLLGVHMSEGALVATVARTGPALDAFAAAVRTQLAEVPVACFDETGLRVAGHLAWVHSVSTDTLTLYTVHSRRGTEAMDAAGILPDFTGVAVHDGWKPYRTYTHLTHALCNAHHLRELAGIVETDPERGVWAQAMTRLLVEINNTVGQARDTGADGLDSRLLAGYRQRYHDILETGEAANPPPEPGQRRRTVAGNLINRLTAHTDDVLRFAHNFAVPFTNNLAESDIRMVKLRQKISGCFRTFTAAETFCKLRSYLSTARKNGITAIEALQHLHQDQIWMPTTTT